MDNQFSRTALLIGESGVNKLHKMKVAIVGLGGVGSFVAEALVRVGIENFLLIDNDKVDITNINRQIIATTKTIGQYKVDVMKNRMLEINPNANIEISGDFFSEDSSSTLFNNVDYIADAIDTISSKIELVVLANKMNIPIISAMGTGNKLNPTQIEVTDIYKTEICPLAKIMRKELKKKNIKALKVVYSKEKPIQYCNSIIDKNEKQNLVIGSVSFVPSVAGLIIASEITKDLLK